MAQILIFISYSRADAQFLSDLVPLLHETYGFGSVFYDEQISGGEDWWQVILGKIAACNLFIYLCSNESLQSEYCQKELRQAVDRRKPILPVIVRPKTEYPYTGNNPSIAIPDDIATILRDTQRIDLSRGFRDRDSGAKASAQLYGAIHKALERASLGYSAAQQPQEDKRQTGLNKQQAIIVAGIIIGIVVIIVVILSLLPNGLNGFQTQESPTATFSSTLTTQQVAVGTSFPSETPTLEVTSTAAPSNTASETATPSNVPDLTLTLQLVELVETQTRSALLTEQVATGNAQSTLAAFSRTPTATLTPTASATATWTPLPTAKPSSALRPTQISTESTQDARAVVNVPSANLRDGPGTNYRVVGSAVQGSDYAIVATTSDRLWYLVMRSSDSFAWLSASVIDVSSGVNPILVAATIPPSPVPEIPVAIPPILEGTPIPGTYDGRLYVGGRAYTIAGLPQFGGMLALYRVTHPNRPAGSPTIESEEALPDFAGWVNGNAVITLLAYDVEPSWGGIQWWQVRTPEGIVGWIHVNQILDPAISSP